MKCFYHQQVDAIALCKSCHRALCSACAADVPPGTACISRCERDVEALNVMVERGKSAYQKTGVAYKRNAVMFSIMGTVFVMIGILPVVAKGRFDMAWSALMGLVFLVWAYFTYRNGEQIQSTKENA